MTMAKYTPTPTTSYKHSQRIGPIRSRPPTSTTTYWINGWGRLQQEQTPQLRHPTIYNTSTTPPGHQQAHQRQHQRRPIQPTTVAITHNRATTTWLGTGRPRQQTINATTTTTIHDSTNHTHQEPNRRTTALMRGPHKTIRTHTTKNIPINHH